MSKKQYNVNREVNDPFYRYKMPGIVAKVEGQGNGIKTVIVNMVDIARALNREPVFPTKFFGMELGAQTQIDEKNDRFIVNGSHDEAKLQDILDVYIKKFVLCSKCENPETTLTVKRDDIIECCKACGHKGRIRSMAHSLSNFIVRQHKNKKIADGKNKKKGEAKSTTKDIYAGEATEVVTSTKVNGKAAKDEWDGEEWAESESEDEADQLSKLSLLEMKPSIMSSAQKGEAFEMYIDQLVNDGSILEMMKAKEKIMQIVLKAEYYGLKQKACFVFFEKLMPNGEFVPAIKKFRPLFVYINRNMDETSDLKAMKYCISALEVFLFEHKITEKIAIFLKIMYDQDILDEESIIEWGDSKPSKKYISKELSAEMKATSRKLVDWLKTAESESEEESSDDDIEMTDKKIAGVHEVEEEKPAPAQPVAEESDDGEDVDIEDI